MFHNLNISIKSGAILISDAHYNPNRTELFFFLKSILDGEIKTTQIVLMGDIFDFLASQIDYFTIQNKEMIELLNQLSQTIEIIYLEGNHDYNLKELFSNIKVIPRDNQPVICEFWDETKQYSNKKIRKIILSHGDIFTPKGYNLYTSIIRNSRFLKFLNFIDFKNWLTKKIDFWLRKKDLSEQFEDFEIFAIRRLLLYKTHKSDFIIEGHFHQGKSYKHYTNLPAFGIACEYKVFPNREILHFKRDNK